MNAYTYVYTHIQPRVIVYTFYTDRLDNADGAHDAKVPDKALSDIDSIVEGKM